MVNNFDNLITKFRNKLFTVFVLLILIVPVSVIFAQDYSFSIPRETVHAVWENDGTLTLAYEFVFENDTFASPIDFVDVGIPTSDYSLSNIYASIDGEKISHVEYSAYVSGAIELGLGNKEILAGQSGIVRVQISSISNVLYIDSKDDEYASAVFSPTWFDGSLLNGDTDLTVIYHMPPNVMASEPRYHGAPSGFPSEPIIAIDEQGRVTYTWRNTTASASKQYTFGASFPASYVPTNSIEKPTFWQNIGITEDEFFGAIMGLFFCGMFLGVPALIIFADRKRKLKYLPPKISIAGHGIKRGLTAIEAAILLEEPMNKVFTMILFAVIKKEAAAVISQTPLKLSFADPQPAKLRPYEIDYLEAMQHKHKTKRKTGMQKAMVNLIKSVSRKMKGFSKRETVNYYKSIINRAWAQVEKSGTPKVKSEAYDKVMEWTMLDKEYDQKTRDVFYGQPVFLPRWWGRYSPSASPSSTKSGSGRMGPSSGGTSLPNLPGSEFAASMVTGVQDFASGVVGDISNFTSGITNKTNPVPKSTYSGSSRSGGGGSSCACACAGCACACAGGGR
jgi:hypothetical protein